MEVKLLYPERTGLDAFIRGYASARRNNPMWLMQDLALKIIFPIQYFYVKQTILPRLVEFSFRETYTIKLELQNCSDIQEVILGLLCPEYIYTSRLRHLAITLQDEHPNENRPTKLLLRFGPEYYWLDLKIRISRKLWHAVNFWGKLAAQETPVLSSLKIKLGYAADQKIARSEHLSIVLPNPSLIRHLQFEYTE